MNGGAAIVRSADNPSSLLSRPVEHFVQTHTVQPTTVNLTSRGDPKVPKETTKVKQNLGEISIKRFII